MSKEIWNTYRSSSCVVKGIKCILNFSSTEFPCRKFLFTEDGLLKKLAEFLEIFIHFLLLFSIYNIILFKNNYLLDIQIIQCINLKGLAYRNMLHDPGLNNLENMSLNTLDLHLNHHILHTYSYFHQTVFIARHDGNFVAAEVHVVQYHESEQL